MNILRHVYHGTVTCLSLQNFKASLKLMSVQKLKFKFSQNNIMLFISCCVIMNLFFQIPATYVVTHFIFISLALALLISSYAILAMLSNLNTSIKRSKAFTDTNHRSLTKFLGFLKTRGLLRPFLLFGSQSALALLGSAVSQSTCISSIGINVFGSCEWRAPDIDYP